MTRHTPGTKWHIRARSDPRLGTSVPGRARSVPGRVPGEKQRKPSSSKSFIYISLSPGTEFDPTPLSFCTSDQKPSGGGEICQLSNNPPLLAPNPCQVVF